MKSLSSSSSLLFKASAKIESLLYYNNNELSWHQHQCNQTLMSCRISTNTTPPPMCKRRNQWRAMHQNKPPVVCSVRRGPYSRRSGHLACQFGPFLLSLWLPSLLSVSRSYPLQRTDSGPVCLLLFALYLSLNISIFAHYFSNWFMPCVLVWNTALCQRCGINFHLFTAVYFQPVTTFLLFNVGDYVGRQAAGFLMWVSSFFICLYLLKMISNSSLGKLVLSCYLLTVINKTVTPLLLYTPTSYTAQYCTFSHHYSQSVGQGLYMCWLHWGWCSSHSSCSATTTPPHLSRVSSVMTPGTSSLCCYSPSPMATCLPYVWCMRPSK